MEALGASLAWLEMRSHWRFLSGTMACLREVRQWKLNVASLLCVCSCWERPARKQMQWSGGEKGRIRTSVVGVGIGKQAQIQITLILKNWLDFKTCWVWEVNKKYH